MKAQQYREMSQDELVIKLSDLRKHLFELSSQSVTEKIENSKAIRNAKREIARIMTVVRQMRK
jgi:large subunit ribosomal protein L29